MDLDLFLFYGINNNQINYLEYIKFKLQINLKYEFLR